MKRSKVGAEIVGRAFRGADNIVRWVYAQSTRGLLHLRWLDEPSGVWYSAGTANPKDHRLGQEVQMSPKIGDEYLWCGPLGTVAAYRLTDSPRQLVRALPSA